MRLETYFVDMQRQLTSLELELAATLAVLLFLLLATIAGLSMRGFQLVKALENAHEGAPRAMVAWSNFTSRVSRALTVDPKLLRVKIYVDHANFIRSWRERVEGGKKADTIAWGLLPATLLATVGRLPLANGREVIYCGTNLYVSYHNREYYDLLVALKDGKQPAVIPLAIDRSKIEDWRQENDRLYDEMTRHVRYQLGYTVNLYDRFLPYPVQLADYGADGVPLAREKLVDTHLCTDLVADAACDVYDVAIILTADKDFRPPVNFVQAEQKKAVALAGFAKAVESELAGECQFKINLEDMVDGRPIYSDMRIADSTQVMPVGRAPRRKKRRKRMFGKTLQL
jgi:uncharacterized LabA/DUF88 family protein